MMRRCPQCGSTTNDVYGFCVKCGREFPEINQDKSSCPLCGYKNPDEADYCVKCGTPLVFKNGFSGEFQGNNGPIVVKKEYSNGSNVKRTSRWLILFGYIFSILGGILGLIIAIYLSTRKDPVAKRHGHIQLAIFIFYIIVIGILFATGNIPADMFAQYKQLLSGNLTVLQR